MEQRMATSMQLMGKVEIKAKCPGMNDMIAAAKAHWAVYAKMKKDYTYIVSNAVMKAGFKCITNKCIIIVDWHEPEKGRRDPDNVFSAKKFIFDGLVSAGVLPNDNFKWVAGARDNIHYDLPKKEHGIILSFFDVVI